MSEAEYQSYNLYNYQCPEADFNLNLQGSFSGASNSFIRLYVDYCNQAQLEARNPGKVCKSRAETDALLPNIIVDVYAYTSYFDD